MERFDFNQFLKKYVYLFDLVNYNEDKGRKMLEEATIIMNSTLNGEMKCEFVILPSEKQINQVNLYVVFDENEMPEGFSDGFLHSIALKVFEHLGVSLK